MDDELKHCEAMGYDAVMNKANERNCHFTLFSTPEKMRAWEAGQKRGMLERWPIDDRIVRDDDPIGGGVA